MKLRPDILLSTCLSLFFVAGVQAGPTHATRTTLVPPLPSSAARLVAWKSRAWLPSSWNPTRSQGVRVAIDPVDGAFSMPRADELTAQAVPGGNAPVRVTLRPDGSGRAQLDERFEEFAVVSLGADGKPAWTCVHGRTGAQQFMQQPAVRVRSAAPAPGTLWEEK